MVPANGTLLHSFIVAKRTYWVWVSACAVHPFTFYSLWAIALLLCLFLKKIVRAGDILLPVIVLCMSILCVQFNFYSQYCSATSIPHSLLGNWKLSRVESSHSTTHTHKKRHDFVHELTSILFRLFVLLYSVFLCSVRCAFKMNKREIDAIFSSFSLSFCCFKRHGHCKQLAD